MVSLLLQKRLAAAVMGCGQRKVWLDPNEVADISMANSREFQNQLEVLRNWADGARKDGWMLQQQNYFNSKFGGLGV